MYFLVVSNTSLSSLGRFLFMQLSPVSGADMRLFNPGGANMVEVPAGGCVVFVLDIDKAQKF